MIDWSRVAAPQDDLYDALLACHLASTTTNAHRPEPFVHRVAGHSPRIFDGAVSVRYVQPTAPGAPVFSNGPLEHPNIDAAVDYVRRWPVAFEQMRMLIDSFHPLARPDVAESDYREGYGSYSGSTDDRLGTLFATIFDPIGLAQAFVHEMGHNKLRALGINLESADRLVLNPADELYVSPVIKDRLRPMTAVLHAEYSFAYITALDIVLIETEPDEERRQLPFRLLRRNLARIEEGVDEIRRYIRVDRDGEAFVAGLYAWIDALIARGRQLLETREAAAVH
ncbi:aKG-HExxH-type peptide beta-hydroxylase [Bradyrhizobium oligotrophicum]|uniref:aKG-HExxH-type peptide beta-hydroxylase n=1 Tax=Bradyrhizobium oligotrophicum TaxID=44255 RepID=UPI003EBAFEDF